MKVLGKTYSWFQDEFFYRLIRNAATLLSGDVGAAIFDLGSLALTARALGPDLFGVLVLIQTYVRVVDTLLNFQSWQAIIKYGADSLAEKRHKDFKALIKFGTMLDVGSAVIGTLIAIVGVYWVASWLAWKDDVVLMAMVFCFVIMFNLVGTPTAVLRLFNRFKILALQRVLIAGIKLIFISIAFLMGANLWTFLLILMFMYIFDYMVLFFMGWRELYHQGYEGVLAVSTKGISKKYDGLLKFVGMTHLSSSIRLGAKEFDVLLVGAMIGTASSGIYKIAKQFGSIPLRLSDPLQKAIYPDLAKLWSERSVHKFRTSILRVGVLSGLCGVAIWIVFIVVGKSVLKMSVGGDFVSAYTLLLVYMAAHVIYMFGVAFRPAMLSLGHPERIVMIYTVGQVVYFIVLFFLLNQIGVLGAAFAQIVFHSCWFLGMSLSIVQYLRMHAKEKVVEASV